ncbi:hypothetical protein VPMG_00035 [Vibrio phage VBP32]|uniref:Uncharacterized protein n=2 Tax=Stoningtonvirus VBP47 TaxID=2846606 RepID=M4SL95_9CAUD|nr:hypothetical protein VPNG_00093 [Vibrio phage VBP47]YP_007676525.1 hypothetical protein VPMG_00035 [Vibrio phage VBP32]AGH57117.1 hypothetical protein VPNG_00093 [Vibrio phage VBP47]AGH57174.1 hypothetical protein VPMG_00035 [Vibrio phage VBP32]
MNGDTKYKLVLNVPVNKDRKSNIIQNQETMECNWVRNSEKVLNVLDERVALSWKLDSYLRSRASELCPEVERLVAEAEIQTGRELRMAALLGTLGL